MLPGWPNHSAGQQSFADYRLRKSANPLLATHEVTWAPLRRIYAPPCHRVPERGKDLQTYPESWHGVTWGWCKASLSGC